VIVSDFYVLGGFIGPQENDAPLTVDTDRVFADKIAFQRFEPVSW